MSPPCHFREQKDSEIQNNAIQSSNRSKKSSYLNKTPRPLRRGTSPQNIDIQIIVSMIPNVPHRFPNSNPDMPVVE